MKVKARSHYSVTRRTPCCLSPRKAPAWRSRTRRCWPGIFCAEAQNDGSPAIAAALERYAPRDVTARGAGSAHGKAQRDDLSSQRSRRFGARCRDQGDQRVGFTTGGHEGGCASQAVLFKFQTSPIFFNTALRRPRRDCERLRTTIQIPSSQTRASWKLASLLCASEAPPRLSPLVMAGAKARSASSAHWDMSRPSTSSLVMTTSNPRSRRRI